ncbi:hypothetical protein GRF29_19g1338817, partial [Pseudopithomyces chartarum]
MRVPSLRTAAAALLFTSYHVTEAATPEQWRSRSIYQLLTDRFGRTDGSTTAPCNPGDYNYCGGSWRGIINQLDYIQEMGFTAIWISPIAFNIPDRTPFGYAYHGYWQQDLTKVNSHFGTENDLKALSDALHARDMYLMIDVIVNHNGWNGDQASVDYSKFIPFNDKKYYHDFCSIDYNNQTSVEVCWLGDSNVELVDLKTDSQEVVDGYKKWIADLVSKYSLDGLRIDTVKHVDKDFWSSFREAAGVFCMGEVVSSNPSYVCDYQNHLDSILNFPAYDPIVPFLSNSAGTDGLISVINDMKSACKDVSVLGIFTESHDVPRIASWTADINLAKNALVYTFMWDGIPIVYAGQEQHFSGYADPANREATWLSGYDQSSELYITTTAINAIRNHVISIDPGYTTYGIKAIYNDAHTAAFRKGTDGKQIVSVITNGGENSGTSTLKLAGTGWRAGTEVVEILTCRRS